MGQIKSLMIPLRNLGMEMGLITEKWGDDEIHVLTTSAINCSLSTPSAFGIVDGFLMNWYVRGLCFGTPKHCLNENVYYPITLAVGRLLRKTWHVLTQTFHSPSIQIKCNSHQKLNLFLTKFALNANLLPRIFMALIVIINICVFSYVRHVSNAISLFSRFSKSETHDVKSYAESISSHILKYNNKRNLNYLIKKDKIILIL